MRECINDIGRQQRIRAAFTDYFRDHVGQSVALHSQMDRRAVGEV